VRLSFCAETTRAEAEAAAAILIEQAQALRELAPRGGRRQ
jgi:cysteine sulfinate desulfinase/cysteine desulfurase-like protein